MFIKRLITNKNYLGFSYPGNCILLVCNRTHGKPTKTRHQIDVIFSLITHLYYSAFQRVKRMGVFWFCFCSCDHLRMHCSVNVSSAYKSKGGQCTMRCTIFKVLFLNLTLTSSRAEVVTLIKLRKHRKQNFLNRILCRHILGKNSLPKVQVWIEWINIFQIALGTI